MTDYQFAYLTGSIADMGDLALPNTSLSAMRAVLQPKASELILRHHMVWLRGRVPKRTSSNNQHKSGRTRLGAPADFQSVDEDTVRGDATTYTRTGTYRG
jgi:hypothetical protein